MTELRDAETDSGIEDRGSDSIGSDSHSTGSGSHSSTSSLLDVDVDMSQSIGTEQEPKQTGTGTFVALVESGTAEPQNGNEILTSVRSYTGTKQPTAESKLTIFVQKVILQVVARPAMLPQMIQYSFVSGKITRAILRWSTRFIPIVLFTLILFLMGAAMLKLRPSDHPPQFFDPDSNIQKMLDLEGNLTQPSALNCWDCSAWYSDHQASPGGGGMASGLSGCAVMSL